MSNTYTTNNRDELVFSVRIGSSCSTNGASRVTFKRHVMLRRFCISSLQCLCCKIINSHMSVIFPSQTFTRLWRRIQNSGIIIKLRVYLLYEICDDINQKFYIKEDRQYNGKKEKKKKRQTMLNKPLHGKIKI